MNTAVGLLMRMPSANDPSARTTKLDAKFRDEVSREAREF